MLFHVHYLVTACSIIRYQNLLSLGVSPEREISCQYNRTSENMLWSTREVSAEYHNIQSVYSRCWHVSGGSQCNVANKLHRNFGWYAIFLIDNTLDVTKLITRPSFREGHVNELRKLTTTCFTDCWSGNVSFACVRKICSRFPLKCNCLPYNKEKAPALC